MKKSIVKWMFVSFIFLSANVYAQVPADYYPLKNGNFWSWTAKPISESSYMERGITDFIAEKDSILGREYLELVTTYIFAPTSIDSLYSLPIQELIKTKCKWLRDDTVGKIIVGYIGKDEYIGSYSSNDLLNVEYFPNDSSVPGFIPTGYDKNNITFNISTEYVSENISVMAGTFNDCLKKTTEIYNNGEIISKKTEYYAKGIGKVLEIDDIPKETAHRIELVKFENKSVTFVNNQNDKIRSFSLKQNYPNPFNAETTIDFSITTNEPVNLSIYNLTGQKVRDLVSGSLSAGNHSVIWNGRDNRGNPVSSGIYFSRFQQKGQTCIGNMLLLK
jgi:hypothetical protein